MNLDASEPSFSSILMREVSMLLSAHRYDYMISSMQRMLNYFVRGSITMLLASYLDVLFDHTSKSFGLIT